MSKDVTADDEEGLRIKEQAILDLGSLFCHTKKAKGMQIKFLIEWLLINVFVFEKSWPSWSSLLVPF